MKAPTRGSLALATAVTVLALAAASEITGAVARASHATLVVRAAEIDQASGVVRALDIQTPGHATRYVVSDDDGAGVWAPSASPNGTARLIPQLADPLAAAGQDLTVTPLDDTSATGGPAQITLPFAGLGAPRNAGFAGTFTDAAPFAWKATGGATVERMASRKATALRIALERVEAGTWNVAGLQQRIARRGAALSVEVLAEGPCDGASPHPRALTGVSLASADGTAVTYCISPAVRTARTVVLADKRQAVVLEPGRLGAWSRLEVRPPAGAAAGLLSGDAPLQLFIGIKVNPVPGSEPRAERVQFRNLRPE